MLTAMRRASSRVRRCAAEFASLAGLALYYKAPFRSAGKGFAIAADGGFFAALLEKDPLRGSVQRFAVSSYCFAGTRRASVSESRARGEEG
jgi:hypothetical protein